MQRYDQVISRKYVTHNIKSYIMEYLVTLRGSEYNMTKMVYRRWIGWRENQFLFRRINRIYKLSLKISDIFYRLSLQRGAYFEFDACEQSLFGALVAFAAYCSKDIIQLRADYETTGVFTRTRPK